MTSKRQHAFLSLAAALMAGGLSGCAGQPAQSMPAPDTLAQNDFPTLARVEFVMQCMQKKGGQNYNNLYSCVCSADKLAEKIRYETYAEAQTFGNIGALTGDRGNAMRDAPQGRKLKKELQAAISYAQDACTVAKPGASE